MTSTAPIYRSISRLPWHEVLLVGGGPSLKGFDFEKLRDRTVCAINDAMLHLPWAAAVFSADNTWIENRRQQLLEFAGEKYLAAPPIEGPLREYYLERGRNPGLSNQPNCVNIRGCSGYGALGLAYLKGAKRIVLMGFDFVHPDSHWYSNYEWSPTNPSSGRSVMYRRWADHFNETKKQLDIAGVEVLNASPISAITTFRKVNIDELLR